MKRWWPQTIVRLSCLVSNNNSSYEPGGTMIITHSRATAHTCLAGEDSHGLGRWNFITLKGKLDTYTTIISIYRPATSQETYNRQVAYSAKRRKTMVDTISPETLWYSDLGDLIKEQCNKGHNVIVAGDFNDDLNNEKSTTRIFMNNLGLRELLLESVKQGPATHIRGTTTIDGVFATSGIRITNGNYTSFEESPSDHRWMVIDIQDSVLIGVSRDEKCPPIHRKVTSKIPSVKERFQHELEKQVTWHNLYQKVNELYKVAIEEKAFRPHQQQEYEKIEVTLQRCVQSADRKCRKVRRGKIPFSPLQKKLMGSILVLKQLRLRWLLKSHPNRPRMKKITRMIKKYDYGEQVSFRSLNDINQALSKATNTYNDFKRTADSQRWVYLESIAREYSEIDGKGMQHHYRILQQQEQSREHFRRIRFCEGKSKGKGVECVQVDVDGEREIIYDRTTIEREIMRANKDKLLQARETPLCQQNISILLGEQGDFQKWEQVLRGLINLPDDVDEGLRLWYDYIINQGCHSSDDISWTTDEYINSWSKMDENKATIPGILVAHIKCMDVNSISADITSKLALIPLLTGYSPNIWRKGIDSMIPKRVADLRPEKLRLILLMDARFNHNNKLIGKKMMEYGERKGLLAKEQYGSRKHKSASDHSCNKRFTLDLIRQSGQPTIYIANDAKSCYDRIILLVAYLTMRTHGISETVAQSTIYTILNMKHHVRTAYGDSTEYYGGEKWDTKPHGCGQGNGYGPALWACISSPLLHILRRKGCGTKFLTPLSMKLIHLAAFSFVDDTDIFQTINNEYTGNTTAGAPQTIERMYSESQQTLDLWANLLAATGGALEPSKTFYVPILPYWHGTTLKLDKSESPYTLSLTTSIGTKIPIERKQSDGAFFSLGMWQSPNGSDERQTQYLIDTIKNWGSNTSLNKLTWQQARMATRCTIGRTLVYSLSATAFTVSQCHELQKAYMKEVLGKIGIVRTFPSCIAVAPTELGGLGLLSFEQEQLSAHVSLLLQHGPYPDSVTGQLLEASMEYHCLETGLEGDPLLLPVKEYTTATTWIKNTLTACRKYGIVICSGKPGLIKWATNDSMIMDLFLYMDNTALLRIINKVRMYLRITTIADLLTADGQFYDTNLIHGKRAQTNPNPSFYRYHWPDIPPPSPKERSIWFQVITTHLSMDQPSLRVHRSTTFAWNIAASEYAKWVFSSSTGFIYQRTGVQQWTIWKRDIGALRRRTRSAHNTFKAHCTTGELPCDSSIIGINKTHSDHISPQHFQHDLYNVAQSSHTITLDRRQPQVRHVDKQHWRFLYNIAVTHGTIFSDGSFGGGKATYAIVRQPDKYSTPMENIPEDELSWEAGIVSGNSKYDMNSYRAELAGILHALVTTIDLCMQANITQGECTLYCDNEGAILAASGRKRPTPRWASYDLVRQIRDQLYKSPITWHLKHIKGHQDRTTKFATLSYEAQGNVLADFFASRALRELSNQPIYESSKAWEVRINGDLICGNLPQRLTYEINKPIMKDRWIQLLCPTISNSTPLNWGSFFRCWTCHPPHTQIQVVKYFTRTLPVGKNLKRRRHAESEACPCCGEIEDHDHLLLCKHNEMANTFEEECDSIAAWTESNMPETISISIRNLLMTFRDKSLVTDARQPIQQDQQSLGLRAFFAGLWLQGWEQLLETWYVEQGSKRAAEKWITYLVSRIQLIPLAMWKTRNHIMHQTQDNTSKQQQHDHLNDCIEHIFKTKPHSRLMAHCDNFYFTKHTKEQLTNMKLQRKTNWVAGANLIISKYEQATSTQSERFLSFFQFDPG